MKNYLFFFVILAITFTSCDKNEPEVKTETQKYVKFPNNNQLVSVLNKLDNGVSISEILPKSNFYSMWDLYQEILRSDADKQKELIKQYPNVIKISKNEEDEEISLNLNDKTLAKVLSPDGVIKIGNKIIKVEGEVIKVITNGDDNLIPELKNITVSNSDMNIIVDKIISYHQSCFSKSNGMQKSKLFSWSGYEYYNNSTRCNWDKWIDYNPVFDYAEVGAEVTNQQKNWLGIWANWFSSTSYMYLHLRSDYLNCTNYSYGGLLGDPALDLYNSGNTNNISVSKRFSNSGNVTSGNIMIDFIYRGNTYNH